MIRDGRLRAIGLTSRTTLRAAPEIAPLSSFDARLAPLHQTDVWYDLAVAPATPPEITTALNTSVATALRSPELLRGLVDAGYHPSEPTAQRDAQRFVAEQVAFWSALVRSSEATVD